MVDEESFEEGEEEKRRGGRAADVRMRMRGIIFFGAVNQQSKYVLLENLNGTLLRLVNR